MERPLILRLGIGVRNVAFEAPQYKQWVNSFQKAQFRSKANSCVSGRRAPRRKSAGIALNLPADYSLYNNNFDIFLVFPFFLYFDRRRKHFSFPGHALESRLKMQRQYAAGNSRSAHNGNN